MKIFTLVLLLIPGLAWGYISGIDDFNANLSSQEQKQVDGIISTYYQHPSPEKVDALLDFMNNSSLLQKKSSWPPIIGFLTVIFENNKEHLFSWMMRNDYNLYAQDVFVAALLHAKLKETAIVFGQAHQWRESNLTRLRMDYDSVDLRHLLVILPGHIDTLWGAFFASGDPVYVNEIMNILFQDNPVVDSSGLQTIPPKAFNETQKLAESTLKYYAPKDAVVMHTITARMEHDRDAANRRYLKRLLDSIPEDNSLTIERVMIAAGAGLMVLVTAGVMMRNKRKPIIS